MASYGKARTFTKGMRVRPKGRRRPGGRAGTVRRVDQTVAGTAVYMVQWDGSAGHQLGGYRGDELMPVEPPADYREEHERTCAKCGGGVTRIFLRPPLDDADREKRAADLAAPCICPNCNFVAGVLAGVYGK